MRNELYQHNGLDIILSQTKGGVEKHYSLYTNPVHELFACLLNYLHTTNNFPKPAQISSINGVIGEEIRGNLSDMGSLIRYFKKPLPFVKDSKIKVISENLGELGERYFGYIHDNDFVIGVYDDEGIERVGGEQEISFGHVKEHIRLDQADALNVMRGIYFFSNDKLVLRKVYDSKDE